MSIKASEISDLIKQRIDIMRLDDPWYERYFSWLGGAAKCLIGQCDLGLDRQKVQGDRQTDGLLKACGRVPQGGRSRSDGMQHQRPLDGRCAVDGVTRQSSPSSASGSHSWTGWAGMMVEMACL